MKYGISGQVLGGAKSLEETVLLMKKYGIENMEVWPENIPACEGKEVNWSVYEGRDIKKAKKILEDNGMKVVCVTMGAGFDYEISSDAKKYSEALTYAVEVAKELGAGIVNNYCYNISLGETPDTDKFVKYVEPAVRLAESEGIVLCLENEAHDSTRTPEGMLSMVKAVNSKNFKTNFDATNYYHAGVEAFPHAYEVLKGHIGYVHIKNGCIYDPGAGHSEKNKGGPMTGVLESNTIYYPYIAEGEVNIDGLLLRLERDGYDGYCVLEPHTVAENAESYFREETAYLKNRGFIK